MARKPHPFQDVYDEVYARTYRNYEEKHRERIVGSSTGMTRIALMGQLRWRATDAAVLAANNAVRLAEAREKSGTPLRSSAAANTPMMLPKPCFKITPQPVLPDVFSSVVQGENHPAFRVLERKVNNMRTLGTTKHLLLVGPPSIGKTTTAQIVARAVGRPFLPLSGGTTGSDLFDLIEGAVTQLHEGNPYSEVYKHPDNNMPVYRLKPTVLFVDEAHAMSEKLQTLLLMATEKPYVVAKPKGGYMDFRDVLLIMGTTDPSLKPGGGGFQASR